MATATADALVVFGVTGDLAHKKIFPALQGLVRHGQLEVPVIGVARGGSNVDALRERIRDSLEASGDGLDSLIAAGQDFHGLRTSARRYDCGDKLGFLEANIALGLRHPALGAEFRRILASYR